MGWADLDPRNRGRIVRATIVLVVLVGAMTGFTVVSNLIGDGGDPALGQVVFPGPGEAQASLLNNGDPAWVIMTLENVPVVLSARSTQPAEEPVLVEWCADAQAFVDPASGSLWDSQGRYLAGPAPHDLAHYEFTEDADEATAVLQAITAPAVRSEGATLAAPCDAGMSTSFDP